MKGELGAGQTTIFPLASPPHESVLTMRTLQVIFGMEQDPDHRKGWLVGAWAGGGRNLKAEKSVDPGAKGPSKTFILEESLSY